MNLILASYIREILLIEKKQKNYGAGFVVVKKFGDEWKVLGLQTEDDYDLPKGRMDSADGGDLFRNACRECYEECDISITPKNLLWGSEPIKINHLTIFLAATNQVPRIKRNEKSGIYEHLGADWLSWEEIENLISPALLPAIYWAKNIVEDKSL